MRRSATDEITGTASPAQQTVYLTSKQVRARYGGISDMSLWRWLKDDSNFPTPMRINGRRYWLLAELEAWEAHRNQEAV